MQFIRKLLARLGLWRPARRAVSIRPAAPLATVFTPPVYREVTRNAVRVYSLCGCCGARLRASATLCDSCAQRQSGQARPI